MRFYHMVFDVGSEFEANVGSSPRTRIFQRRVRSSGGETAAVAKAHAKAIRPWLFRHYAAERCRTYLDFEDLGLVQEVIDRTRERSGCPAVYTGASACSFSCSYHVARVIAD